MSTKTEKHSKRLWLIGVGFAIFLTGISLITKDIPVPSSYILGAAFIVAGLIIVGKFEKRS